MSELPKAIALAPEFADGHYNLGKALSELRRVPEAMRCHEEAIRVEPGHAGAHFARALNWLRAGDFERGWEEYEWRWRLKQFERLDRLAQLWGGSNPSWTRRRSSDASIW